MASLWWTLLLAVVLLALVLRLVYVWQISHALFFDLRLGDAEAYLRCETRYVRSKTVVRPKADELVVRRNLVVSNQAGFAKDIPRLTVGSGTKCLATPSCIS